jgi:L-fuconolactonase
MTTSARHVVDSHIHFWDQGQLHYPWLDDAPALPDQIGPEDVDSGAYVVDAMVFVQAECLAEESLAEVRWVRALAERQPVIAGIVARAQLEDGPGAVDALAGEELVVGVRRLIQDEPAGFATSSSYVDGVRRAGQLGLAVDLCVRWHQLPDVVRLSRLAPNVTFVLDHVGKPPIADGGWEPWASDLVALADNPNVHCKLSGLSTEAGPGSTASLTAYLKHALDAFGPARCLVGSDWPVASAATTYAGWLDTVVGAIASCSAADQDRILRHNAMGVYGLAVKTIRSEPRPGGLAWP